MTGMPPGGSGPIAAEFSFRTRARAIEQLKSETFDLLVIGGGITGAATARDALSRGLSVALIERGDFACGTSSASTKMIHGGLRYLENFELGLVFEALSERAFLLKTAPHMVRPLPFYFPVYKGDTHGKWILRMGMWLYDCLALFRTPEFHKGLSARRFLEEIPTLKSEGLKGGFKYSDASMLDAALVVETLRSAVALGTPERKAALVNYVEATDAIFEAPQASAKAGSTGAKVTGEGEKRLAGFHARDLEEPGAPSFAVRARQTVICCGPWTDELGKKLSRDWAPWLEPSKGVHLVFDLKRLKVPGALVMSHPEDGRISFVIARPDLGAGVTIVGTTDSPVPRGPDSAGIDAEDVSYLLRLVAKYFPTLDLKTSDILSAYVGTRPLVGGAQKALQKVSREHHIERGPGGAVIVAGGKYTTHRKMAEEIVDFALKLWRAEARAGRAEAPPASLGRSATRTPVNPLATPDATREALARASAAGAKLPDELVARFGAEAQRIFDLDGGRGDSPEGFPCIEGQLRHAIRSEGALHLSDFYLRRSPLMMARADHGLPWAERLARVWAEERGAGEAEGRAEVARLEREIAERDSWRKLAAQKM